VTPKKKVSGTNIVYLGLAYHVASTSGLLVYNWAHQMAPNCRNPKYHLQWVTLWVQNPKYIL